MAPSFMDKARAAAQQAIDEAKKGIDSGQAKLDELQAKKESERLLTALGAAFYAEQRHGAGREPVNAALNAVDVHVSQYGMVGFPDDAMASPPAAAPPSPSPTPPGPPSPPPTSAPSSPSVGGSPYDAPSG